VVLFFVLVGVVAVYVIPSFPVLSSVNIAVEGTKAAALFTPTPIPTAAPAPIEVLQAELAALPKGNPDAGQAAFTTAGCVACHSLEPDVKIVGPSQAGIAARAAARKPGYSAEVYLYESITRPNIYLVEGFQPDLMPKTFKETLKPQEIADLIAFCGSALSNFAATDLPLTVCGGAACGSSSHSPCQALRSIVFFFTWGEQPGAVLRNEKRQAEDGKDFIDRR